MQQTNRQEEPKVVHRTCWPYRNGQPSVEVVFTDVHGNTRTKRLFVDSGNPFELVIDPENMAAVKLADAPNRPTNFGQFIGGWVCIGVPDLGLGK